VAVRSLSPRIALSLLTLSFLPMSAFAANEEPTPKTTSITRTTSAPKIDGVLDEAVWDDAIIVEDLHQTKPVEYAAPLSTKFYRRVYSVMFSVAASQHSR
jgi:hypothetical protein